MKIYEHPKGFGYEEKEDTSPVTDADFISSEVLIRRLSGILPEALVISEEGPKADFGIRSKYQYVFLVDPLDGTKEFIKRNDEFCINIGLVDHGVPILGLIYAPAKNQVYYGIKNGGAWHLDGNGQARRIMSSSFDWTNGRVRFITSRSHMNPATTDYIRGFNDPVILQRGSAIKFLWIARGDADVYPKKGRTMEWDTAAGQIILEEAGGQVLDFNEKSPLRYNKERLSNPDFIAFGKTMHGS